MTSKLMAAVAAVAFMAAGAAEAQDAFQPKAKGGVVLNVRLTEVAPQGRDPIVTLAGAPTGLRADVAYDVMPTIGLSYFLSDHVAIEAIAGTTKHAVKAKGPGA